MERPTIRNEATDDANGGKPVYARKKWAKPQPGPKQGDLFEPVARDASGKQGPATDAAAEAARSAAASGEHRTAAAAGGDGPLFQSYGDCCDKNVPATEPVREAVIRSPEDLGQVVGHQYVVRPCMCRRWFCEYCGPKQGYRLRYRLGERLKSFTGVFGVTLTVDPKLFESQLAAWTYVMQERLLSRFVRELHRRGLLRSKAYFWVVEFQNKKTLQSHWHLLLDATRIEFGEIVEIWSRFRPGNAPQLGEAVTAEGYRGKAPAFGSVRFTARGLVSALAYTTAYLTKYPKEGYPDWVLDRAGRMPRYGRSHGFFPRESDHDRNCFCEECRGDVPLAPRPKREQKEKTEGTGRRRSLGVTIRQRLQDCGRTCNIVQVRQIELPNGLLVDGPAKFNGTLKLSLREACEFLGVSPEDCWQLELSGPEVTALEEYAANRQRAEKLPIWLARDLGCDQTKEQYRGEDSHSSIKRFAPASRSDHLFRAGRSA